jgi:hypothetical protein
MISRPRQTKLKGVQHQNGPQRTGEKKPPDSLAVFREFSVFRLLTPLSIRQRSEIPEKVKIKAGERHGKKRCSSKKVEWLYNLTKRA